MAMGFVRPPIWRDFAGLMDWVFRVPMQGKFNCVGSVTLTANAATTTLNDPRIGGESVILFMATTANAQAIAVPYVTARGTGTCTLNHANNANTDKSFDYIVIG